ncbi:MAG TPA: ABC transporter ATP-binding protein [Nitrospirae bacterium]|nr:oligopeptide transport ATP-binding protein OppF [bacterium BMS3Abin10]GBE38654.1 oligopeptide transport ATP-binding protein OppF [bacterium BMS3Bbin08]HDH50326.1 ABC transporter ATP-binding protein [Nitrospirota bacterium]HDK16457.1 ABC transporter ATP-binding protein [Nitrospirota bacterium]HDK41672.1 ABC transporter ATP-binding protein [Nitrospirota bacterium]
MKEILRLRSVKKYFPVKGEGVLKAVDDISFSVKESQVFGLVGESGCGKSTVAKLILKLIEPTGGEIFFDGVDVVKTRGRELSRLRKGLQIVFQDPQAALNPRMRVVDTIGEALFINGIVKKRRDLKDSVKEVLHKVGLDESALYKYPHEFSGGQRQRICIARALAVEPRLIVADEPLSALDVSIQAQIINLLEDLQKGSDLAYVLISHDLHVIEYFSDVVAVMYLGKIVEMSDTSELFTEPLHPYTEALLSAVPSPEVREKTERIFLKGDVPSPVRIPAGCPFHPRCHKRFEPCDRIVPEYREVMNGRRVSCHLHR